MSSKQKLWDAEVLAEFSNLDEERVGEFRAKHRDFVPQAWWDYRTDANRPLHWKRNQEWLREAWKEGFELGLYGLMRLVTSVFDPEEDFAMPLSMVPTLQNRPAFASLNEMREDSYPYQKAVIFLGEQKWRARYCRECGKRYVADHPKRIFCSDACSHQHRNKQKLASWNKHGRKWRKKQR
jgi:hypothetical protein